jgi:superfamily II DNA helicase RecQ
MELLNVYQDLVLGVGEKITVRDEDALNKGRLVEKYDSCTDEQLKTTMQSFIVPNGVVCVVLVTCAFGMGIDCPNVYKVFLRGPPSTIAMYVQEIGWSSGSSNPLSCM